MLGSVSGDVGSSSADYTSNLCEVGISHTQTSAARDGECSR